MDLYFLKTLILKFQEKNIRFHIRLNRVKRLIVNYLKTTTTTITKKNNTKNLNMLTIRVDCERINGRYTNAELRLHSPSWANYFKIIQIFTKN